MHYVMKPSEVIAVFHAPQPDAWKPLIALLPESSQLRQVSTRLGVPESELESESIPVDSNDLVPGMPLYFVAALWPNLPTIPFVSTREEQAVTWRRVYGPARSGAAVEHLTVHQRPLGWVADSLPELRENFLY